MAEQERTILVTGASSGIGAAVCRRLAAPGVRLAAHARLGEDSGDNPALRQVVAEARERGADAHAFHADLAATGAGDALITDVVAHFGDLDQIVSNAGFANRQIVGDAARAELDRAMALMTGGFFDLTSAALPMIKASRVGAVVAISSFVAHVFPKDHLFPTTAAAKGGLEAIAKALAVQLAGDGVTVNCVAPGFTRKDPAGHSSMNEQAWKAAADATPMGRIAEPDDIAATVEFLLGPGARHITGQTIAVDGGLGLV